MAFCTAADRKLIRTLGSVTSADSLLGLRAIGTGNSCAAGSICRAARHLCRSAGRCASCVRAAPGYAQAPTLQYGGFWVRFVAYLVDGLIVGIPMTAIIVTVVLIFGAGTFATLKSLPRNPDPDQIQAQFIPITALIGAYEYFL